LQFRIEIFSERGPLTLTDPSSLGLDTHSLDRLGEMITRHLTEGRYPAAQIAYISNGRLPDPWHGARLDVISNCVHASINGES
jgi:hypothetical protein